MLKIVLFVSVCVSIVCSYDFTDSDFNFILQSDILENSDFFDEDVTPTNYRMTRDTQKQEKEIGKANSSSSSSSSSTPLRPPDCIPPGPGGPDNRYQRACCGERDDLKMHGEALKELRRECFKELRKSRKGREDVGPMDMFNCDRVNKMKDDTICAMECVARKKDIVDGKGNLLPRNVTSFVKSELVTKDWQKEIIDGVLAKCLEQNTRNVTEKSNGKAITEPERKCNSASLKFSHCIWREMQLSCPKDLVRKTRSCDRMRERLQKKEYPDFDRRGRPRPARPDRMKNSLNDTKSEN